MSPHSHHRPADSSSAAQAFQEVRGPAPAGAFWIQATWSQELPVSIARVWALVSSPDRRPEWDASTSRVVVDPDGSQLLIAPDGTARTQRVVQLEHGRAIAWRRHRLDPADIPPACTEQVEQLLLTGDGTRTVLRLQYSSPGRGTGVRLSRPLLRWMLQTKLRHLAQRIGQAV